MIPVIFFEAFDSPMASQAEKDLEKLLAIDVFVNHLPEDYNNKPLFH